MRNESFDNEKFDLKKNPVFPNEKNHKVFKIIEETVKKELYEILSEKIKFEFLKDFCIQTHSKELIFFYIEITLYKMHFINQESNNENSEIDVESLAKSIIEQYILPDSPFEINIDQNVANDIIKETPKNFHSFDKSLIHVLELLNDSIFPRFIKSQTYLEMQNKIELEQIKIYQNDAQEIKSRYQDYEIILDRNYDKTILNYREWRTQSREPNLVAVHLLQFILHIIRKSIERDRDFNLEEVSYSVLFRRFVVFSSELKKISLDDLGKDELKCFFINIYHVMLLHLTILYGPPIQNRDNRTNFKYIISDLQFCLDDIKYGILRNNTGKNSTSKDYFRENDVRKKYVVPLDPKINFVLSNLSEFSPPIRVFFPENIDHQLEVGGFEMCSKVEIIIKEKKKSKSYKVEISPMFEFFGKDFGNDAKEIISNISKYFPNQKKELIQEAIKTNQKIRIIYPAYKSRNVLMKSSKIPDELPKKYGDIDYLIKN
ncbi:electron carrier/ protein disulfide oxidoreductase [Anaeramoeba ignava]|uniref:Electron carrier/ protein disulfide oxidoreductase n=1 Tax=Anaeramoeba ignava TaxID=1746090 RepID=A0A9Q0LJ53_ANAIG|nr:electron carrier/ protein disulfide oxidoreductase [Anaeramoeba ignava]